GRRGPGLGAYSRLDPVFLLVGGLVVLVRGLLGVAEVAADLLDEGVAYQPAEVVLAGAGTLQGTLEEGDLRWRRHGRPGQPSADHLYRRGVAIAAQEKRIRGRPRRKVVLGGLVLHHHGHVIQ